VSELRSPPARPGSGERGIATALTAGLVVGLLASATASAGPSSVGGSPLPDGSTVTAATVATTPTDAASLPAEAVSSFTLDSGPVAPQPFTDHRNPPSYRKLSDAEFARYDFGMTVFNTQFVVAGTPNAGRRDGVGPLFNSSSCDACHNNGARGRGPTGDGPAPDSLVIQPHRVGRGPARGRSPDSL
jgi:hypothetical protein